MAASTLDDDGEWVWHDPNMRQLELELRCLFCRELFSNPVVLRGCGHSFCSACIRQHLASSDACPRCRVAAELSDIRPNFSLEGAARHFKAARPELLAAAAARGPARSGRHAVAGDSDGASAAAAGGAARRRPSVPPVPSSSSATVARLPQLTYSIIKDKDLKLKCAGLGLSEKGPRDALLWRHRAFTTHWNAAFDGPEGSAPVAELVLRTVYQLEQEREGDRAKAASVKREQPKLTDFSARGVSFRAGRGGGSGRRAGGAGGGTADAIDLTHDDLPDAGAPPPSSLFPSSSFSSSAAAQHGGPGGPMAKLEPGMERTFALLTTAAQARKRKAQEEEAAERERASRALRAAEEARASADAAEAAIEAAEDVAAAAAMMAGSSQASMAFAGAPSADAKGGSSRVAAKGMVLVALSQQGAIGATLAAPLLSSSSATSSSPALPLAPAELPPGWVCVWSERAGRFFYFQASTDTGSWEQPLQAEPDTEPEAAPPRAERPAKRARRNSRVAAVGAGATAEVDAPAEAGTGAAEAPAPVTAALQPWACPSCTLVNKSRRLRCETCGDARP